MRLRCADAFHRCLHMLYMLPLLSQQHQHINGKHQQDTKVCIRWRARVDICVEYACMYAC